MAIYIQSSENEKPTIWDTLHTKIIIQNRRIKNFSDKQNLKEYSSTAVAAAAAKLLQSCPTLCDPIDGSPPGSPVPGILQARTLEWVAVSFSNAWKWKVKVKSLSLVRLLVTPWTAAYQAPRSIGFSRQEYWSGLPLPSPTSIITTRQFWYKVWSMETETLYSSLCTSAPRTVPTPL